MKKAEKPTKTALIDVIGMYIGQKMISYWGDTKETDTVRGIMGTKVIFEFTEDDNIESSLDLSFKQKKGNEAKLVLRSLSTMTKEEADFIIKKHTFRMVDMPPNQILFAIDICKRLSEQGWLFAYLLKQGFDMFGLIESGQAVEK